MEIRAAKMLELKMVNASRSRSSKRVWCIYQRLSCTYVNERYVNMQRERTRTKSTISNLS